MKDEAPRTMPDVRSAASTGGGPTAAAATEVPPSATAFAEDFVKGPLVSVIVTNFNYERFIIACLRSILAQTYRRFECIVVDDCSKDGSVAAIRRFIATEPGADGIRLIACPTNGGQMNAFIEGFQASRGDFVVFVDADDYLFPDFIETHLTAHLNVHQPVGLTCSDEIIVDGEGAVLAGTYRRVRNGGDVEQLSRSHPITATTYEGWRSTWRLTDGVAMGRGDIRLAYIAAQGNPTRQWIWSTTSGVMFRRSILDLTLTDNVRDVRICADYYLFHFCHLIGGSMLIHSPHGCYRMHGSNNFAASSVFGGEARVGALKGGADFAQIWDRIGQQIMAKYALVAQILGEPQALRLLTLFNTMGTAGRARRAIGPRGTGAYAKFLGMLIVRGTKKRITRARRMLRFV